ncbi:tRNA dihydrouridine synthase DusB [Lewinella sp. 4G2]|uniref:tRNA dihydrouridine synthase DusB n=1 Tax=Lewinella sp. 4G2 TaxID=1803372 RepID=UPI0007B48E87|nr:tRNA dihydrouridine synthase DusB [Lewinella sp. 4G2]OAV42675.1 nitrogen fixation protein NifR [Lewinella sp. 4G2]
MVKIADIELGEFPLLLAPMEDVSDPPFRALCKEAECDMMYTEFISVEGLIRDATKSVEKLDIFDYERPVGIQIFGANIESMIKAADIVEAAQPELLDINFGCPVKKVTCKGAGAGILQDIPKMVKLTKAIVDRTNLPVTVKTRLGWDNKTQYIEEVAERLQDVGIKALSIHGRTRQQMYKGEADWTLIGAIKDNPRISIPIFGNGDIDNPLKAEEYRNRYGVDGIMIGRAAIGNPWIFREIKHYFKTGEILPGPTLDERVNAAKSHLERSIDWKGVKLGVLEMRRHYTNYFRGLPNVKHYRQKLVQEYDTDVLFATLEEMRTVYAGVPAMV